MFAEAHTRNITRKDPARDPFHQGLAPLSALEKSHSAAPQRGALLRRHAAKGLGGGRAARAHDVHRLHAGSATQHVRGALQLRLPRSF